MTVVAVSWGARRALAWLAFCAVTLAIAAAAALGGGVV
jgi:hypothetical protein